MFKAEFEGQRISTEAIEWGIQQLNVWPADYGMQLNSGRWLKTGVAVAEIDPDAGAYIVSTTLPVNARYVMWVSGILLINQRCDYRGAVVYVVGATPNMTVLESAMIEVKPGLFGGQNQVRMDLRLGTQRKEFSFRGDGAGSGLDQGPKLRGMSPWAAFNNLFPLGGILLVQKLMNGELISQLGRTNDGSAGAQAQFDQTRNRVFDLIMAGCSSGR